MPGYTNNKRKSFSVGHRKAHSLGTNVLSSIAAIPSNYKTFSVNKTMVSENKKNLCLIDDSLINDEPVIQKLREPLERSVMPSLPTIEIIYDESEAEVREEDQKPLDSHIERRHSLMNEKIIFQGRVKRKTVIKDGRKPSMTSWVRYWLVLQGTQLLYFDHKQFKSYQTNIFHSTPLKCRSLKGWIVALVEDIQTDHTFTLSDNLGRNVYKFKASTATQAYEWYKKISQQLSQFKCNPSTGDPLIDFEDDSNHKSRLQIPKN
ncbi:unnamed protein product [Oppiella nova]|uniref:PH domain-containing protein n=1 Tax=Oppiella nova TaxID=334625 RepID=A0A7R9M209_9ACAR|nr:unnamed protein product [Oppiella nova]CAG2169161.1 unnamed protein product [Oppiella nova]